MNPKRIIAVLNKFILNPQYIIGLLLFIFPFFWFSNGMAVLGGEMFTFPYYVPIKSTLFTWSSNYSLGLPNLYVVTDLYLLFYYFLSLLFQNSIVQKILFGLIISSGFFSFYYLLTYLKIKNKIASILGSLFYVFNPYYIMMFPWFPTYGMLFLSVPLFLKQIFIIFSSEVKMKNFIYLFFISLLMSIVAANIALFIFFIMLLIIYFLIVFFSNIGNRLNTIKKLAIIFLIIIMGNLFWILPLFLTYRSLFGNAVVYETNFQETSLYQFPILNGLTLHQYYWFDKKDSFGNLYYSYSNWYNLPSKLLVLFILFFTIYGFLKLRNKGKDDKNKKIYIFFSIITLCGVFLSKGTASPLGSIYKFLLKNIKLFGIYRSPDIKFPFFITLGYSFLFANAVVFFSIYKKIKNYIFILLIIFVIFLGFPLINGNIFNIPKNTGVSAIVNIPYYWYDYSINSDLDKLDSRTLLFPKNISVFDKYNWGYEGAWLSSLLSRKSSIAYTPGGGSSVQEHNFSLAKINYQFFENNDIESMKKAMSLFNIKNIIERNDFSLDLNTKTSDSYESIYNPENVLSILNKNFIKKFNYGEIISYSIDSNYFLQHFYVPKNILISYRTIDSLSDIISKENFQINTAIFFMDQNSSMSTNLAYDKKILSNLQELSKKINTTTPIIEFKKISPTKYRAVVHKAKYIFPLVFSESFENGWEVYIVDHSAQTINTENLNNYKILEGNEENQAKKDEVINFIKNGYISCIGKDIQKQIEHNKWENNKERKDYIENYNIDFISKNFQNTIQNNNLKDGPFYETWFKKPLENNKNHLVANGYANSWVINPSEILNNNKFIKNKDGTYDFELVIEYLPQKMHYQGLLITGLLIILSILYLIIFFIRNLKKRELIIRD